MSLVVPPVVPLLAPHQIVVGQTAAVGLHERRGGVVPQILRRPQVVLPAGAAEPLVETVAPVPERDRRRGQHTMSVPVDFDLQRLGRIAAAAGGGEPAVRFQQPRRDHHRVRKDVQPLQQVVQPAVVIAGDVVVEHHGDLTRCERVEADVAVDGGAAGSAGGDHDGIAGGVIEDLSAQRFDRRRVEHGGDQDFHRTSQTARLPASSPGSMKRKRESTRIARTTLCTPG